MRKEHIKLIKTEQETFFPGVGAGKKKNSAEEKKRVGDIDVIIIESIH